MLLRMSELLGLRMINGLSLTATHWTLTVRSLICQIQRVMSESAVTVTSVGVAECTLLTC